MLIESRNIIVNCNNPLLSLFTLCQEALSQSFIISFEWWLKGEGNSGSAPPLERKIYTDLTSPWGTFAPFSHKSRGEDGTSIKVKGIIKNQSLHILKKLLHPLYYRWFVYVEQWNDFNILLLFWKLSNKYRVHHLYWH